MSNPNGIGGFTKNDPRCWRYGRPKSFDAARKMMQKLLDEPALDDTGHQIIWDGHVVTKAELIARGWIDGQDKEYQLKAYEYAYGKVPGATDITSGGKPIKTVHIIHGSTTDNETNED